MKKTYFNNFAFRFLLNSKIYLSTNIVIAMSAFRKFAFGKKNRNSSFITFHTIEIIMEHYLMQWGPTLHKMCDHLYISVSWLELDVALHDKIAPVNVRRRVTFMKASSLHLSVIYEKPRSGDQFPKEYEKIQRRKNYRKTNHWGDCCQLKI